MLEAILNPEKTSTEADIEAQPQEALVSTIAAIDLSLDDSFYAIEAIEDTLVLQADYVMARTKCESNLLCRLH
jgi:hypothetical protein